jgi:ferredoxin
MLVIKPDECIDCGVCEPECPIDAIKADTEGEAHKWLNITQSLATLGQILARSGQKMFPKTKKFGGE